MPPPDDKLAFLLSRPQGAGVYHLPACSNTSLERAAGAVGLTYSPCDLEETQDLDAALAKIGRALDFPDWYGGNLDALHDCLTDLSWRERPDTVLVVTGCDSLRAALPEAFDALLNVFAAAIDYWKEGGNGFWVFIDTRSDGIATLPTIY